MDVSELKQFLLEDVDRIITILDSLNFHHIKEHTKHISCGQPDGDRINSTIIKKNESISVKAYTRQGQDGDIFTLIMAIKDISFPKSIRYVHDLFKLKYTYYGDKFNDNKVDLLSRFRKAKSKKQRKYTFDSHPEYILNKYDHHAHVDWTKEGILPSTIYKFDVKYDEFSKRILITHRKWDTGEILGVFGRTTVPNYKELEINKYVGILPFDKGGNVYGLNLNYKAIKDAGEVIVFEAEKSVLKCDSLGVNNTVAIGCHNITKEQRQILISLNVKIIIAFDKGLDEQVIIDECKPFKGKRDISYIWDTDDLLEGKDAPIDEGLLTFEILLEDRKEL